MERLIVALGYHESVTILSPDSTPVSIRVEAIITEIDQPEVWISDHELTATATLHRDGQAYLLRLQLTAKLLSIIVRDDRQNGLPLPRAVIEFALSPPFEFKGTPEQVIV